MHQQCQYQLFGNQSLDTLTSVNYIIKGSILELKDKEYEYNFKNMEINLFSKENETVINAVESHHNEVEQLSVEAVLVQAADSISASRPGARRETLSNYLKRLEQLEEIANSHEGIESSYAIQAGRELRLIVHPDEIDDDKAMILSREVAKEIEEKMQYPGQIKVTVIRETRAIEYAK